MDLKKQTISRSSLRVKPPLPETGVAYAVCAVSFTICRILLGGTPLDRTSFWKTYRDLLTFNRRTKYRNYRVRICADALREFGPRLRDRFYWVEYRTKGELKHESALPSVQCLLPVPGDEELGLLDDSFESMRNE